MSNISQDSNPSISEANLRGDATMSSSSTRGPLPPPPKFDPSAYRLPPKDALSNNKASLPTLSNLPIPPPPIPPLKSVAAQAVLPQRTLNVHSSDTTVVTTHEIIPHSIHEVIPPLTSAPNSGTNLAALRSSPSMLDENDNIINNNSYHDPIVTNITQSSMSVISLPLPPPPPPPPPPALPPSQKAKRHNSSSSAPALKLLSPCQSHVPILILATSTVQSMMIRKNQMTLGQLFTALINSCRTHAPHLLGRFAPFRSIHRTLNIKWEDLFIRFYDGELKGPDESSSTWEEALSYACHTWEGDHTSPLFDTFKESNLERRIWKDYLSSTSTAVSSSISHGADQGFELTAPHHLPWLLRFRSILDSSTCSYQQEMIQCPPIVLLVASTNEITSTNPVLAIEGAIGCLAELSNIHHWPIPFHNGLYDPKAVRREFLLLHDEVEGPTDFADATALREMQNRFGPGCCGIIRMNSVKESQRKMMEDPMWDTFVPTLQYPRTRDEWREEMSKHRGLYLEEKDLTSIRRYLIQMISLALIPCMERRIANLNLAVTNGKKGVKNALKSLWRKPKDGSTVAVISGGAVGGLSNSSASSTKKGPPSSGEGVGFSSSKPGTLNGVVMASLEEIKYRYDSIESQTRLLADTLFLMRDYEAALDTYRLVKDDYKQDRSMTNCATVYEMMALCLVLLDIGGNRNKREILQYMDSALFFYSSAADEERPRLGTGSNRPTVATLATRCATRLCLVLSSHRNICSGNDLEMADMLASTSSNETAVAAGTLLEQSASHYYRAGMYRKFGFHMLMAGHMFRSSGQDHHSLRCFTSAMYVYTYGRAQWDMLSNHVSSALAGQLQSMGKMFLCVQLYAKLVSKGGKMSTYVKNLLKSIDRMVSESNSQEFDTGLEITSMRVEGNVVEFSNLDFPLIRDSSVKLLPLNLTHISPSFQRLDSHLVIDDEAKESNNDSLGSDNIWEELMTLVEAEVQVGSNIDTSLDMLMAEICTQSKTQSSLSKPIKKVHAESRTSRIRMEPISVKLTLTNPLSVALPISELQLVARVKCKTSGRIYSNEHTIEKSGKAYITGSSTNRLWTFQSSQEIFYIPDFEHCYWANEKENEYLVEGITDGGPYFVTSKMTLELQPLASLEINLEICPLHVGEMDMIGIRWKAFNQFWVYHAFQKLKPSSLLKLHIEQDLPNLVVDFVPTQRLKGKSTIFQGQVREWTMKVSNIGTAPASNLLLKANLPWIRVSSSDNIPTFVGPTGTFIRVPIKNSGIIGPGQIIEIPIEMRPSGGGRQECYMLFRYQLAHSHDNPATVRWIRKIISFPVYPSITMTASLMPFYRTKTDHVLSLDVRSSPLKFYFVHLLPSQTCS